MKVKVVSLQSEDFQKDLIDSIKSTGFVVLTDHGIAETLIRDSQSQWKEFFNKEVMYKKLFENGRNPNYGYKGMKTEKAVGAKVADLKEYYHWRPGQVLPQSIAFDTMRLFDKLEAVGGQVLRAIDCQNKMEGEYTDYAGECFGSENTLLRSLYYPALDFSSEGEAVRAAAHEDINHITLLVAASAPGLQVMDLDGKWHDVPHEENSIVMNVGDMLQLASKGKYKSTTHRVVNPPNNTSDRISMPLFIHPHTHIQLSPEKTAGEYLAERIAQIHGKK